MGFSEMLLEGFLSYIMPMVFFQASVAATIWIGEKEGRGSWSEWRPGFLFDNFAFLKPIDEFFLRIFQANKTISIAGNNFHAIYGATQVVGSALVLMAGNQRYRDQFHEGSRRYRETLAAKYHPSLKKNPAGNKMLSQFSILPPIDDVLSGKSNEKEAGAVCEIEESSLNRQVNLIQI